MNRIKELRKDRKITITELSEALKIPQSTLTNYENGKRSPRDEETWEKLANYFGVSVPYVMGLNDIGIEEIKEVFLENDGELLYENLDYLEDFLESNDFEIQQLVTSQFEDTLDSLIKNKKATFFFTELLFMLQNYQQCAGFKDEENKKLLERSTIKQLIHCLDEIWK